MDYIAGSFYDGFVLYAMALEETLAEGGAQNDGISITLKMQNRRMWGEQILFEILKWCFEKKKNSYSHGCLGIIFLQYTCRDTKWYMTENITDLEIKI